jgi:hypothetical protein
MLIHGDREPASCVVVMKLPNLGAPANLSNPRASAIIAPRLEAAPGIPAWRSGDAAFDLRKMRRHPSGGQGTRVTSTWRHRYRLISFHARPQFTGEIRRDHNWRTRNVMFATVAGAARCGKTQRRLVRRSSKSEVDLSRPLPPHRHCERSEAIHGAACGDMDCVHVRSRDVGKRPTWRHLLIRTDPTGEFSPSNGGLRRGIDGRDRRPGPGCGTA